MNQYGAYLFVLESMEGPSGFQMNQVIGNIQLCDAARRSEQSLSCVHLEKPLLAESVLLSYDHIQAFFILRHYQSCIYSYTVSTSLLVEHIQPRIHIQPRVLPDTIDGFMMPEHTYGEAV